VRCAKRILVRRVGNCCLCLSTRYCDLFLILDNKPATADRLRIEEMASKPDIIGAAFDDVVVFDDY